MAYELPHSMDPSDAIDPSITFGTKTRDVTLRGHVYTITVKASTDQEADDLFEKILTEEAQKHFEELTVAYNIGVITSSVTLELDPDPLGTHTFTARDFDDRIFEQHTFKNDTGLIHQRPATDTEAIKQFKYKAITDVFQTTLNTTPSKIEPFRWSATQLSQTESQQFTPQQKEQIAPVFSSPKLSAKTSDEIERQSPPEEEEMQPKLSSAIIVTLSALERSSELTPASSSMQITPARPPLPSLPAHLRQLHLPDAAPSFEPPVKKGPVEDKAALNAAPPPSIEAQQLLPEIPEAPEAPVGLSAAQTKILRESAGLVKDPQLFTKNEDYVEQVDAWRIDLPQRPLLPEKLETSIGAIFAAPTDDARTKLGNETQDLVHDLSQTSLDIAAIYKEQSMASKVFSKRFGALGKKKMELSETRKKLMEILNENKKLALQNMKDILKEYGNQKKIAKNHKSYMEHLLIDDLELVENVKFVANRRAIPEHIGLDGKDVKPNPIESVTVHIGNASITIEQGKLNPANAATYKRLIETIDKNENKDRPTSKKELAKLQQSLQNDLIRLVIETDLARLEEDLKTYEALKSAGPNKKDDKTEKLINDLKSLFEFTTLKLAEFSIKHSEIRAAGADKKIGYVNEFQYLIDQLQYNKDSLVLENLQLRTNLKNSLVKKLQKDLHEASVELGAEKATLDQLLLNGDADVKINLILDIQRLRSLITEKSKANLITDDDIDLLNLKKVNARLKYIVAIEDLELISDYDPQEKIVDVKNKAPKDPLKNANHNGFIYLSKSHIPVSYEFYVNELTKNKKLSNDYQKNITNAALYLNTLSKIKSEIDKSDILIEREKHAKQLKAISKRKRKL